MLEWPDLTSLPHPAMHRSVWLLLFAAAVSPRSAAQCPTTSIAAAGPVETLGWWDPDAAGPQSPLLVAGGSFDGIGGTSARGLAVFDPATNDWSTLGSAGITAANNPRAGRITATASMPNGDLVVAGTLETIDGVAAQKIAIWNGSTWAPLGAGFNYTRHPAATEVHALAVLPNGDLIAGGNFDRAGGLVANGIARWDGSAWQTMGSGVEAFRFSGTVRRLAVTPNGDLIVAGLFQTAGGVASGGVARWDGTWQAMPPLPGRLVNIRGLALSPTGQLFVGGLNTTGTFELVGNAWVPIGAIAGAVGPQFTSCFARSNGNLVVVGSFDSIGGVPARGVAEWDGQSWNALGTGVWGGIATSAIELGDDDMLVGGWFRLSSIPYLARWVGSDWWPIGMADVSQAGNGCIGPNGQLALTATPPAAGSTVQFECSGFGQSNLGFIGFGCSTNGTPLSNLHPVGDARCTLNITPNHFWGMTVANGIASWQLPIPNAKALVGLNLYVQTLRVVYGAGGQAIGVYSSNGLLLRIGGP